MKYQSHWFSPTYRLYRGIETFYPSSSWVPKPDEKEEISEYLPLPQYRFAFKNPKSKSPQSNKKRSPTNKKPKKTNQGKKDAPQKDAIEPKPKKDAIEKDTKADKNVLPKKKEKARKRKRPRKKKNEKEGKTIFEIFGAWIYIFSSRRLPRISPANTT